MADAKSRFGASSHDTGTTPFPEGSYDGPVPSPESGPDRCNLRGTRNYWTCSLPVGHMGEHVAYQRHDPQQAVLERWHNTAEPAPQPQPERPERCPTCGSAIRGGRGLHFDRDLEQTVECNDLWHDTAAPAPQPVHAPDFKQPEPLIAPHRQCSECGAEVVWGNGQWQHARQAEAGYRQCTRYPYPPVPVGEAPAGTQWISVRDRLPHTHTVLGVIHNFPRGSDPHVDTVCYFPAHDPQRIVECFGPHPDEWRLNGSDEEPDRGVVEVSHWMELPVPPVSDAAAPTPKEAK